MTILKYELRKCTVEAKDLRNHYVDDKKVLAKNENELETLIQTVRIYSQYMGI